MINHLKRVTYQPVILLALFVLLCRSILHAQESTLTDEHLIEQLHLYSKSNPDNILFLHVDKTVYTNNETIFFSSYLLKSASESRQHTVLSVALVRDDNRSVCLQKKFEMQNALSYGSLDLPDTIAPGNYHLVAYVNLVDVNKRPVAFFTQPLSVKSISEPGFTASLRLLDSIPDKGVIRASINVLLSDPKPNATPAVTYSTGNREEQKLSLDKQNNGIITITNDQLQKAGDNPALLVAIQYKNKRQYLAVDLPAKLIPTLKIRFFPEGGSLVNGVQSVIGLESLTGNGSAISLRGILYRNNKPVDTVVTDKYGVGKFNLLPDLYSSYYMFIKANPFLLQDTIISLPAIQPRGAVIKLDNAVVNDTLVLKVFAAGNPKVRVLIHNYRDGFASFDLYTKPGGNVAKVALPIVPRGISAITLLDTTGRPIAERLFFAHYKNDNIVAINTDKKNYGIREKVTVRLKLSDANGKPVRGLASVACVENSRIENRNLQDIESYVYLNNDLSLLPVDQERVISSMNYLENVLLIKGWRRYTWQNMMTVTTSDTLKSYTSPVITGTVRYAGKEIKTPLEVSFFTNIASVKVLQTDDRGKFTLPDEALLTEDGNDVSLSVNVKKKDGYSIEIDDPYADINKGIAATISTTNKGIRQLTQTTGELKLEGLQHIVSLQEVLIKSKHDNPMHGTKARGSNECGDYVTSFDYLNAPGYENMTGNHPPTKGQAYIDGKHYRRERDGMIVASNEIGPREEYNVILITYTGCTTAMKAGFTKLPGIYTAREFYGVTEDMIRIPEPQWLSTLSWRPGLVLDEKGEAEYSFYSGDITGSFRIVVQGVGEKDVFYGENVFKVN